MSKAIGLAIAIAIILAASIAVYMLYGPRENISLKIFTAGSLKLPMERVGSIYREKYGIDFDIEPSGSVEVVRKVTDLGKTPDVVAVADYRLIEKYLVPNYTDWYVAFASNELVLAYTSNSKYADEIASNPDKWYEILARPDVKWGFSDPNKDPCGYRATGIIVLAGIYYNGFSIPTELLFSKTNMYFEVENGVYHVYVPASLNVKAGDLVIRPKSVDLISLLESGSIDYAFEYKSVAIQHNLSYIELPREINLGDPGLDDFYAKVVVHILVGSSKETAIPMKSIVYGVTIIKDAPHPKEAAEFLKLLLSDTGREVFKEMGQSFLDEPIYYGNVPEELGK